MWVFLLLSGLFGSFSFAHSGGRDFPPLSPLVGYWDLGSDAAILSIEEGWEIKFCSRRVLKRRGECVSPDHIPCRVSGSGLICEEPNFSAVIEPQGTDRISYEFHSSFNGGRRIGVRWAE